MLACDGVWDIHTDEYVSHLLDRFDDADEASQAIVDVAIRGGSRDNVTVMVVKL